MSRLRLVLAAGALSLLGAPLLAGAAPPEGPPCADGPSAVRATGPETTGTAGDDVIFGTPGNDAISALAGGGGVDGGAGDDTVYGNAGDDRLIGGDGADRLYDGDSSRRADEDALSGGEGDDSLFSESGGDALDAGPGDDSIFAQNGRADTIDCGDGTDTIEVDFADDLVGCEGTKPANAVRSVSPRAGRAKTRFVVRFRGGAVRVDENNENGFRILVTPPSGSACDRGAPVEVWNTVNARLGRTFRSARLVAPGRRHRWCRGTYEGTLQEQISGSSSSCEQDDAPASCNADRLIGRLRFRVR